ncbi:redoxin domain-containing protein [Halorubrum sp. F4]|uniref:redoxin domain-containing protein n=1 Tax=Halorubrum sp. F4 TaxID=2989715 RepID=UPI00248112DD|nr:redoxin domain-containing protein [Halorubrum sp. F4]
MNTTAPDFEVPGIDPFEHEITQYRLSDAVDNGKAVFLFMYPFDFSPVCTGELCGLSDAQWYQFTENVEVWGISKESVYAHDQFADEYDLTIPLLSDSHADIAKEYGVCHDELENHKNIPQRSVFVINRNQEIEYKWTTENPYEIPNFSPIQEAIERLCTNVLGEDGVPDVEIDYEKGVSDFSSHRN